MAEEEKLTAEEEDTQKDKYLTFRLGEEIYGIDISVVIEIIGIQPITSVPEVPDYVQGIINLRGKIIPVVDIRTKFGMARAEDTEETCIIVVDVQRGGHGVYWMLNTACWVSPLLPGIDRV